MDNPELEGVEKPAIAWLVKLGYTHLSGAEVGRQQAHRHMAPILEDVLAEQLLRLNPWLAALQKESGNSPTAIVLRELRKFWQENLLEANQNAWASVIHGSNIQLKDARGRAHSVRFMDQGNPAANRFHVVDQYIGSNSEGDEFRPDLLLFINGLPLAMIECKASHIKLGKGINQLLAYQNSHPRHFVFNQVCVAINRGQDRYGAIYTPEAFYFRYRLDDAEEAVVRQRIGTEPSEQDRLLWALFEPTRFVELVCQFVLFEVEDGRTIKKLPRYQQWRAVRKTLARLTKADSNGVIGNAYGTTTIEWVFQAEPGLKRHYITVERGRPVLLRGKAIPEAEQRQLIRQRARWIRERLKQVNQPCKEMYVTGSRILYRGKTWYCQVQPAAELSKPVIRFANSRFFIQSPQGYSISRKALKSALEGFYRDKAKEKLMPRIRHWQRATGLQAVSARLFKFKGRWASCSDDNILEFHPRCMELSPSVLDYVIVHELCHTVEKSHNPAFWHLVEKHYPDWQRCHGEIERLGVEV